MSKEVHINCPECESTLAVPESQIKAKFQCWNCDHKFYYHDTAKDEDQSLQELLFQDEPTDNSNEDEIEDVQDLSIIISDFKAAQLKKKEEASVIESPGVDNPIKPPPEVRPKSKPKFASKTKLSKQRPSRSRTRKVRKISSKSPAPYILFFLLLAMGGAGYYIYRNPELYEGAGVKNITHAKVKVKGKSDHLDTAIAEPAKINIINFEHYHTLKTKCISCHGEVVNGKAKIKGDFDIMPLLQSEDPSKHTAQWIKVIEQIESGEMPPEEKETLTPVEIAQVLAPVKTKLNDGKIPRKLLSSQELLNTSAEVFNFNKESFDPFQALHLLDDPNARFPTHNSPGLMSESYLYEIAQSIKGIYDLYLSRATRKHHKDCYGPMKLTAEVRGEPVHYLDRDYSKIEHLREKDHKAYNKAKSLLENNNPRLDFLLSGRSYLRFFGGRTAHSGTMLLPGRYRITFHAKAENRDFVRRIFEENAKSKHPLHRIYWWDKELINEKSILTLYHEGQQTSMWGPDGGGGGYTFGAKPGRVIKRFTIEDDVTKKYSCEFANKILKIRLFKEVRHKGFFIYFPGKQCFKTFLKLFTGMTL